MDSVSQQQLQQKHQGEEEEDSVISVSASSSLDGEPFPTDSPTIMPPAEQGDGKKRRSITTTKKSNTTTTTLSKMLRCFVLDLPLFVLFASFCTIVWMRSMWTDYYLPLMERAQRTDEQLLDEYTYYERSCTAQDVTSFPLVDATTTNEQLLDTMMQHGAVIVPELLQPTTLTELRHFVKTKNQIITDDEAYPVSQGDKRLSFGIEATEDPIVIQALSEISSHPLLPQLLEDILGDTDPALTELTAITAYYGCQDQVIHSDTKSDGYAGQYGRTYSHSYSLFIPLQPVVPEMGVTQICPGTHYCTNDMEDICEHNKLGVHQAFSNHIWPAGHGAMINQQVWHGGSAHIDPDAPERILFIVSFIARPQLGKDTRQLARGTYFHMKWNMWGGTFQDIANAATTTSLRWPYNILRSLALYKPSGEHWGYNLLLASVLRAANGQGGMDLEDLETFVRLKMNGLFHYPKWLQGRLMLGDNDNDEDDVHPKDAWSMYIQETLDNTHLFLLFMNAIVMAMYLVLAVVGVILSSSKIGSGNIRSSSIISRLLITHGLVAGCTWMALRHVRTSEWGTNIRTGKSLMRPFPEDVEFTSRRWETDPAIPDGPTTLPDRMDVLFGTRYDADYLGSYNQWLDYHPGNRIFQQEIKSKAYLYPMYSTTTTTTAAPTQNDNNPLFLRALVSDIVDQVQEKTNGGRILMQDHLSGDWVVLSESDAWEMVRLTLATESNAIGKQVYRQIKFLLADSRFGHNRGTALALESTIFLQRLCDRLFGTTTTTTTSQRGVYLPQVSKQLLTDNNDLRERKDERNSISPPRLQRPTAKIPTSRDAFLLRTSSKSTNIVARHAEHISVGSPVMVYNSQSSTWAKGILQHIDGATGKLGVTYEDDDTYEDNVTRRRIRKPIAVQDGARVLIYMGDTQTYEATVTNVFPSGFIGAELDRSGTFLPEVNPESYEIIYPEFV